MKVSELIKLLEDHKDRYGDCKVVVNSIFESHENVFVEADTRGYEDRIVIYYER